MDLGIGFLPDCLVLGAPNIAPNPFSLLALLSEEVELL